MLLFQTEKLSYLITLAFLLVVLQGFHTQVQAESTDKRDMAQTLFSEGIEAFNERDYPTALEKFNESLTIYRKTGDRQTEADLLTWMAATNIETNDFVKALNYLKESQELYTKLYSKPGEKAAFKDVDRAQEALVLYAEGVQYINDKDYESAIKKYKDALQLVREMGEVRYEINLLLRIGMVYEQMKDDKRSVEYYSKAYSIGSMFGLGLIKQGFKYDSQRNYSESLQKYMQALTIFELLGIETDAAISIEQIGASFSSLKDYKKALKYQQRALEIYEKAGEGHRAKKAGVLCDIGLTCRELKDYQKALEHYHQALEIYREIGNSRKQDEGITLVHIAILYFYEDESAKSLSYIKDALRISKEIDYKEGLAIALYWAGFIHQVRGELSKALDHYKRALTIYQEIGDQEGVARATVGLGATYYLLGYSNIPLESYKDVLNIIQEEENHSEEGVFIHNVGQMYSQVGDYTEALNAYKKAMQIFKKLNDPANQGNVLVNIGKAHSELGDYLKAIDSLEKALEIFEGLEDDNTGQKNALESLSKVYTLLGNPEKAQDYSIKSQNIVQIDQQTKLGQWSSLINKGRTFLNKKKFDKALDIFYQTLDISREIGNKISEEISLFCIGDTYESLREYPKALEFYMQSLKVSKEQESKIGETTALVGIATTYLRQQDFQKARYYFEQALLITKETGRKPNEIYYLTFIGITYSRQKNYEKAAGYFEKALTMSKEIGLPEKIWQIQNKLGIDAQNSGQLKKAKSYYSEAINTIESIREKISVEDYKTSFIENKLSVYTSMIYVLLQLKENEEAFNYVERTKSRTLLDLLGNRVKLEKGKDKEVSQEERKLQRRITELLEKVQNEQSQPREKQRAVMAKWKKELDQTRGKYAELILKIKQHNPELSSLVSVDPLTLKEVQNLLEPDITLLEYATFPEGIAIWVVDRSKYKLTIHLIQYTELYAKISAFREKITTLQTDYEKEAEELYDLLIRPAKAYIKTKRICIVPHDVLHYLPFQALINVPVISGIGVFVDLRDGKYTVTSIIKGTPAYRAGLKIGDKIMAIDEDSTINMSLSDAINRLKGEPSTSVLLEVKSGKSVTSKTIKLIRENIAKSSIYTNLSNVNTDYINNKEEKQPRFLIEEYDISYTPSASVLRFVLEKRKEISGKVLAFGNPEFGDENLNLPHAEEEVRKIKESYPKTALYLNEKATEEKVKLLSGDYDIIHFASHGELNPESPLFSSIKMAKGKDEDGRLEVHEIFNLDLENASLVTLSACETGLGKLSKGDELIGLTRGFIYAGTPSILASLWNVNDKSTSDLMGLFYKNLKTHSKAKALRLAQLEMINGEVGRGIVRGVGGITTSKEVEDKPQSSMTVNGSHPYFWAPFILLGDWK